MPDSSTPRENKARPQPEGEPSTDAPESSPGTETGTAEAGTPEPAEPDAAESDAEDPGFENRAARRAKGKGTAAQQRAQGGTKNLGGRGSVQGPRQWGNRRTG